MSDTPPRRKVNRRSWQINLRLKPAESETLKRLAAEQNVTPQEVIRQLLATA